MATIYEVIATDAEGYDSETLCLSKKMADRSRNEYLTDGAVTVEITTFDGCPDCGARGENRGHQTCQYPS